MTTVLTNVTLHYLLRWSEEVQRYVAYITEDTEKFLSSRMRGTIHGLIGFGKTKDKAIQDLNDTIKFALEGENTGIYGYTLTPKFLEIPNGQ